jgi:hypothetical protein
LLVKGLRLANDDGCSIPVSGGDIDPARCDGLFPVAIHDGQSRLKLLYAASQCQLKIAFQPKCRIERAGNFFLCFNRGNGVGILDIWSHAPGHTATGAGAATACGAQPIVVLGIKLCEPWSGRIRSLRFAERGRFWDPPSSRR